MIMLCSLFLLKNSPSKNNNRNELITTSREINILKKSIKFILPVQCSVVLFDDDLNKNKNMLLNLCE